MSGQGRRGKKAAASAVDATAAPAAPRQPGLLDLPDDVLERILQHMTQRWLWLVIPLVCKRLDAVQKASRQLWRHLHIHTEQLDSEGFCYHRFLAWVERRRGAITALDLSLGMELDRAALDRAAAAVSMLAPSLRRLKIDWSGAGAEDDEARALAQLLAPIRAATLLQSLSVDLYDGVPSAELPSLPSLAALAPRLTQLRWSVADSRPPPGIGLLTSLVSIEVYMPSALQWAASLAPLTQLTSLSLLADAGIRGDECDLHFLLGLTGLERLECCDIGCRALPTGISALSRLSQLDLLGNRLDAAGSLDAVSGLTGLKSLTLTDTRLSRLPGALSCLEQLTKLDISGNGEMQLTGADVRDVLARMTSLRTLCIAHRTAQSVWAGEWLSLGRALPGLEMQ